MSADYWGPWFGFNILHPSKEGNNFQGVLVAGKLFMSVLWNITKKPNVTVFFF
jgi:hypothetical protein